MTSGSPSSATRLSSSAVVNRRKIKRSDSRSTSNAGLFPDSRLIDLLFRAKGRFEIDAEAIGEVKQVAQHVGELFVQRDVALLRRLIVEASRLAHCFSQLADLF